MARNPEKDEAEDPKVLERRALLGEHLVRHRLALRLTQKVAAARAKKSERQWQRWEAGLSGMDIESVPDAARAIDADLAETYRLAGFQPPNGLVERAAAEKDKEIEAIKTAVKEAVTQVIRPESIPSAESFGVPTVVEIPTTVKRAADLIATLPADKQDEALSLLEHLYSKHSTITPVQQLSTGTNGGAEAGDEAGLRDGPGGN